MGSLDLHDEYLKQVSEDAKNIHTNFRELIGEHDLEYIMAHIFQHYLFNNYNRENTLRETEDFLILNEIDQEVKTFISKYNIDFSEHLIAMDQLNKIFMDFYPKRKLENRDLANKLKEHEKSEIMWAILKIILWNNLALLAFDNQQYLLARGHHALCKMMCNQLKRIVLSVTPYQEFTETLKYKALRLAEIAWSYDEQKILLRRDIAQIVVEIMPNKNLNISRVDRWIKDSNITPNEILEKYRISNYGNDKETKKARKDLQNKILLEITVDNQLIDDL